MIGGKKILRVADVSQNRKFSEFFGVMASRQKPIKRSDIERMALELYKKRIYKFERRVFIQRGLGDTLVIDLMEQPKHTHINSNYKYILICVESFSRKLYTRPLKNKRADTVAQQLEDIFRFSGIPNKIFSDEGSEFKGASRELFEKHNIIHYHTYTGVKASLAEISIRSLRRILTNMMFKSNTNRWVDFLEDATLMYNNRKHRGLKSLFTPNDVNSENEEFIMKTFYLPRQNRVCKNPKFKVGDFVRLSIKRKMFQKDSVQSFTYQVYKVARQYELRYPCTYNIMTSDKRPILGVIYEPEMCLISRPEIMIIDAILDTKGDEKYCRLRGEEENPIWISEKDITEFKF